MAQMGKMSTGSGTESNLELLHCRLVGIRSHFELSQTEMAEKCGVSLRAYRNYEYGEREPTITVIISLYLNLKISPIWLLAGGGPMIEAIGNERNIDPDLLRQIIDAVEEFSLSLSKPLKSDHKSELITLLYTKARLITEVTGERLDNERLEKMLSLVA